MSKKFVIKPKTERKVEKPTVDEPSKLRKRKKDSSQNKTLLESARQLLETFGNAHLGRTIFSDYAIEYELKDNSIGLYIVFMIVGYIIDVVLALFVIGLIGVLLIAFVYVTLRGLDAWDQTVHIVRLLLEYIHIPMPAH